MNWDKGQHQDYDIAVIEVLVRRDHTGRVTATHQAQSELDHEILASWPSGGLEQVSFSLLAEAIQREALLEVLLYASRNPTFLTWWTEANTSEKETWINSAAPAMGITMNAVISRLSQTALENAVQYVAAEQAKPTITE